MDTELNQTDKISDYHRKNKGRRNYPPLKISMMDSVCFVVKTENIIIIVS